MLSAEKSRITPFAPIGISMTLFACHLFSVTFTGASLNPARSFGPSVVAGKFGSEHWIYWVGPFGGSLLSVAFYAWLKQWVFSFSIFSRCFIYSHSLAWTVCWQLSHLIARDIGISIRIKLRHIPGVLQRILYEWPREISKKVGARRKQTNRAQRGTRRANLIFAEAIYAVYYPFLETVFTYVDNEADGGACTTVTGINFHGSLMFVLNVSVMSK